LPNITLRQELKEKFIKDLTHSEKLFFLKKARESITVKGYQVSEDLFHYCYFITLRERFRRITPFNDTGYLRFLLVEGTRDIENAVMLYEERLEKKKLSTPEVDSYRFIEYLSEQQ
jgi:hypothetical protein